MRLLNIQNLILAFCLCSELLLLAYAEDDKSKALLEETVAEINQKKITRGDLQTELRRQLQGQLDSFSKKDQEVLERELLKKMADRSLLIQAAEREGLIPSDAQVEEFLVKMKHTLPSKEDFERELAKFGLSESNFSSGLKEDLGIKAYLDAHVFTGLAVTAEQLKQAYEASPQEFSTPEEVRVRHILFRFQSEDEKARVRSEAEQVLKQVRLKPNEFGQFARKFSMADNAAKGGDLGFFSKNQLPEIFAEAAFALKDGEVSDVIDTPMGFHILRLDERRGGGIQPLADVKDRVEAKLLRAEREKRLTEHLDKLKRNNKIILYLN